ncbi:MAG: hypothetical protein FWC43_12725 [Planctomycetaceae bacterium]|nr:hypothetical protein [Planctomycetaceae bacterium]
MSYSIDDAILLNGEGGLFLRCAKCHKIVPRDHVLPDKPLAKCLGCGVVFEPQELKRGELSGKSRLQVRRDTDSLEIIQKPLRTGILLWTILVVVLFDIGITALYCYVKQLFPDENPLSFFSEGNGRILVSLTVGHFLLLPIPLWAFFDRRTIRLDRETLKISGHWLLFSWRRTIPRHHVWKASPLQIPDFDVGVKLGYKKGFVWIGCTTEKEVGVLRGEINHFLYTVEPVRLESMDGYSPPAFLGGAESPDPEIGLHCGDCGARLTSESLDFPDGTAHCDTCQKVFSIENASAYRIDAMASSQPENITVEETDDRLTMRYVPRFTKWSVFGNEAGFYFCILMFAGMFALAIGLVICDENVQGLWIIFWSSFSIVSGAMIVFLYFTLADEKNALYCNWTIHLDADDARLELRCKKRMKTIVISRAKIIEARSNEREELHKMFRFGYFPDFLWSRRIYGGHFLLKDGTKHYLPLGSVNIHKRREVRNWMLTTLNRFLASCPGRREL